MMGGYACSTDRRISIPALLLLSSHILLESNSQSTILGIDIIHLLVGMALTSLVPGFLILSIFNPTEQDGRFFIYAILLSIVLSMGGGALGYTILGNLTVPIYLLVGIPGLLLWVRDDTWNFHVPIQMSKELLIIGLITILGIVGGYAVHISASNIPALLFLCILPIAIGILYRGSHSEYPFGLWLLSMGLLYLNSLLTPTLSTGDARIEYYYAHLTQLHGWDVSFTPLMAGMLRISVLHPLQANMSNVPLLWEFKIIHPILVSLIPVGLYYVYREFFTSTTSLFSSSLFLLLSPFFTVLSRNTRTGVAILFVVGLLMLIVTNQQSLSTKATILIPVFAMGLVASHYGTALLFGAVLAVTGIFSTLTARIQGEYNRPDTIIYTAILVALIGFMWYTQVASGHIFRFISGIAFLQVAPEVLESITGGGGSSRAVRSATGEFSSLTYGLLRVEYILLAAMMAIGFWLGILRDKLPTRVEPTDLIDADRDYFSMALVAGGLMASGFLPGLPIGLERVYLLGALVIAPLSIVSIQSLLPRHRPTIVVLHLILATMVIINAGLLGAALNERSPQPELIHESIQESGSEWNLFHLYARYSTQSDKRSSTWLVHYMSDNSVVYGSGATPWESHFAYSDYSTSRPPGIYEGMGQSITNKTGYIYISDFNGRTGVIFPKKWPSTFSYPNMEKKSLSAYRLERCSHIYDSGYPSVHKCE
jgi:uncharacterized membrane protein